MSIKFNFTRTLFVLFLLLQIIIAKSQSTRSIGYTYDDSGNRLTTRIIMFRLINPNSKDSTKSKFDTSKVYSEKIGKYKVTAFPNPTKGILQLDVINNFNNELPQNSGYFIYNETGNIIGEKKPLLFSQSIDFSYSTGIYYLKVQIGSDYKTFKIIKEK
jgi:hypothetical protein